VRKSFISSFTYEVFLCFRPNGGNAVVRTID
jgi:hypothetical protein